MPVVAFDEIEINVNGGLVYISKYISVSSISVSNMYNASNNLAITRGHFMAFQLLK